MQGRQNYHRRLLPLNNSVKRHDAPAPKPTACLTEPNAAPSSTQETPVSSDSAKPDAAPPTKQPADDTGKNQPAKPGTASTPTSTSPAGTILSDDESLTTIRSTVNEVNVVFTVTDRHGRYVKDLKRENFKVVDDNKLFAPGCTKLSCRNEFASGGRTTGRRASNSRYRDRFKFEQPLAAIEFLNQSVRPKYTMRRFIIGFDVTPRSARRTLPTIRKCSRSECVPCAPVMLAPRCMMRCTLHAVTNS